MRIQANRQKKTPTKASPKQTRIPKAEVEREKPVLFEHVGLENLRIPEGARKKKRILGRGPSSGHGQTSTRGTKGQTSRSGRHFYAGFEGAQVPFIKKIPKRGFSNYRFKRRYQIVNIKDLSSLKDNIIDPQLLGEKGIIKSKNRLVKILGEGDISFPITVKAHAFSKAAKDKIEKSGGKIEIINA
jgi:large subunit ribosomal protein L15